MKYIVYTLTLFTLNIYSQINSTPNSTLTLDTYLVYVKQFHPLVKQANLKVNQSQSGIIAARGGFDPKIEIDFEKKLFKTAEYYSILNSTFIIPTWYGIEVKAGFDQMDGVYLNPENTTPIKGLTSLGISIPIGQGLFINPRMADLKKAKLYYSLSQAEKDLEVADVLHKASLAYIDWFKNHNEYKLYVTFLDNAKKRFNGVVGLIKLGDKPAIDSVESKITLKSRKLNLEQSRLKLVKSELELSNYLWINNIPLELQENIMPEEDLDKNIFNVLKTNDLTLSNIDFNNHPKLKALQNKVEILEVEKKQKGDLLKPQIDLNYNYLSDNINMPEFNNLNYKYGLTFSYPLFLRKERGNYKISKFKLQDAELDLKLENLTLKNKIEYQLEEINSLQNQIVLTNDLVKDFNVLLTSEERLFFYGESSLFLINTRENNSLSSSLMLLDIQTKYCNANAIMLKLLANTN